MTETTERGWLMRMLSEAPLLPLGWRWAERTEVKSNSFRKSELFALRSLQNAMPRQVRSSQEENKELGTRFPQPLAATGLSELLGWQGLQADRCDSSWVQRPEAGSPQ